MARILVVDDESLIRVLVADVGESLGHEVLTAASIKEGQDLAPGPPVLGETVQEY